jgi:hypothetical protein
MIGQALFERKVNMRSKVKFELSYMEIYKDDVFDLMVSTRVSVCAVSPIFVLITRPYG